jgi:D-alanine-D-alanine ligase
LEFPCIVKPLGEHASYGITEKSVVNTPEELRKQVEYIWQTFQRLSLVEEFLTGREFRTLVLGNHQPKVLPAEEIIYSLPPDKPELLTYAAKWIRGDIYFSGTKEQCPAQVETHLKEQIEHLAIKAFNLLGCCNYAGIDIRLNRDGQVMVLDINPNTDISTGGGPRFPLEAEGMDYTTFIGEIIRLAKEVQYDRKYKTNEVLI